VRNAKQQEDSITSTVFGLLLTLFNVVLFSYFKPYCNDADDSSTLVEMISLTLILLGGVMLQTNVPSQDACE
jgi:hypothetical protein